MYLKSGSRLTFFIIFLHFLQKYRCVPKIGFSAESSIDIFIGIFIGMFYGISIVILLTFIDKEEEGRKDGVDLFIKSNDPTPEVAE